MCVIISPNILYRKNDNSPVMISPFALIIGFSIILVNFFFCFTFCFYNWKRNIYISNKNTTKGNDLTIHNFRFVETDN